MPKLQSEVSFPDYKKTTMTMTEPKDDKKATSQSNTSYRGRYKTGEVTVTAKKDGPKKSGFGKAFAEARKAGKKVFTWNGKSYHTRLKGEKSAKSESRTRPKLDESKPFSSGPDFAKIKSSVGSNKPKAPSDKGRMAESYPGAKSAARSVGMTENYEARKKQRRDDVA